MEKGTRPLLSAVTRSSACSNKRCYAVAAAYVPSSSSSRTIPLPPRAKPALPTFFTGKPTYHHTLDNLSQTISKSQGALRKAHIFPLPASLAVNTPRVIWRSRDEFATIVAVSNFGDAYYRRMTGLLTELAELREIARRTGQVEVQEDIAQVLKVYEKSEKAQQQILNQKPAGVIDEWGRSVSVGKRKESSARVWLSKTKLPNQPTATSEMSPGSSSADASPSTPLNPLLSITGESQVPTTQVLVNSLPLHLHFKRPTDREYILRPLRLTGLLGHYNIFAQTSGGGATGQAGAIALAVARGVVTLRPEFWEVLATDGLLHRDSRMVERKKTGLAKARKRYAWVKR